MTLIDQSLERVREAAKRFKKKPLAERAAITDSILRGVHSADWDPRASSVRKLEEAAAELEAEHGAGPKAGQRETRGRNPGKTVRA